MIFESINQRLARRQTTGLMFIVALLFKLFYYALFVAPFFLNGILILSVVTTYWKVSNDLLIILIGSIISFLLFLPCRLITRKDRYNKSFALYLSIAAWILLVFVLPFIAVLAFIRHYYPASSTLIQIGTTILLCSLFLYITKFFSLLKKR